MLKEKIEKALKTFCDKYPNDPTWVKIESFELNEKPLQYKGFLGFGWGDQMGYNPQNYTWATIDPINEIIRIDFKRNNVMITHDINMGGEIITHHDSMIPLIDWCRK